MFSHYKEPQELVKPSGWHIERQIYDFSIAPAARRARIDSFPNGLGILMGIMIWLLRVIRDGGRSRQSWWFHVRSRSRNQFNLIVNVRIDVRDGVSFPSKLDRVV